MAIKAVASPKMRCEFIPKSEKGAKKKTKFFFNALDEMEKAEYATYFESSMDGNKVKIPKDVLTNLVKEKCVGWENFTDENDVELEFVSANMKRIPWPVIMEFGWFIFTEANLTEERKKN